jgi:prohibitin 2
MQNRPRFSVRTLGIAILAVLALVVIFSSYTVINPGHRGVVVTMGRVEQGTLAEGFHLVVPPVLRQIVQVDVRTKKVEQDAEAASSDLQTIQVKGILNYHLDPQNVSNLYREVGLDYENIIIVPAMQEAIKAATARYRVENILIERPALKELIREELENRLEKYYIVVEQFTLANVTFSEEFDKAIERKQVAEQAALQKQYELQAAQKDVEIALAKAEGEKKAAIIAAEGQAEARKLQAQAEAEALRLIADQLRGNPDLIKYEWASKLAPGVTTVLLPADQDIILDSSTLVNK